MKKIALLVIALGLLLSPSQGLAAPKKGVTTKNLVSRFESALKFLGASIPIENKKLALETVKREDGRKEFASQDGTYWKIVGITFPSSDIIEDVFFYYTRKTEYATYEHEAFLSALSTRGSAAKRLDDANALIFNVMFYAGPPEDGIYRNEKNNYLIAWWGSNVMWYYRFSHSLSELGDGWRVEKGFLQPAEIPEPTESPVRTETPSPAATIPPG